MRFEDLRHVTKKLSNGGFILVLDTGSVIGPEAAAMLQALHSRSIGGIRNHLEILMEKGPEKFMEKFYVRYGHKSIGDCGDAIVFVEGVPMFVPKAVQDWPLYNGQESSTRFIDFANQTFANPLGTEAGQELLESLRKFYLYGIGILNQSLKHRFPRKDGENETDYDKAIKARAFDIMRGFLPAGAHTNLSWKMNLRQFADEMLILRHHPLEIVREVALATEDGLMEMFPSSFSKKRHEATETYTEETGIYTYHDSISPEEFEMSKVLLDFNLLWEYKQAMATRPPKTELPRKIRECGNVRFEFLLDFGSFRDIQRHRAVVQQMPLLTTEHGFSEWYLSELYQTGHKTLHMQACEIADFFHEELGKINCSPEVKQYYTPMGFNTANRLTGDIHALTYLVELRSGQTVHPTLRKKAILMGQELLNLLEPYDYVLHMDSSETRFDIRRGTHDIVVKE
jgi:thymidylate synthase ThyX